MAKKQVIWSRSAKKDLYSALESRFRKFGDRKLTSLFFSAVERKIQLLRKNRLMVIDTSLKTIKAFSESGCYFYFEEKEASIDIHCVTSGETLLD